MSQKRPTEPLIGIEPHYDGENTCFSALYQGIDGLPPHFDLVESQRGHAEIAWSIDGAMPEDIFELNHR
jgi:hypothetical protein